MRRRSWGLAAGLVVGALALGGCGDGAGDGGTGSGEPITARAVAGVMLDHLPHDTTRREAAYVDEASPEGYVGADFRYRGGEGDDGDLVRVSLAREDEVPACDGPRCVDTRDGVQLRWDLLAPEEDPGIVELVTAHDGTMVTVTLSGPAITRDPRRMRLEPSYAALLSLARDQRLRLRTSAATVQAGEEVEDWAGGEREEGALDTVPNDDQTVVTGFVFGWGDDWEYVGPAPGKALMGEGAIGGRARVGKDFEPVGPGYLDALAAPQPPGWLRTCLPGYTCRTSGPDVFAWRPARGTDPGDAWIVHVNDGGETVALHTVGRRLSDRVREARGQSGFFYFGPNFEDRAEPLSVGMTTSRARYDDAKATTHG